MNIVGAFYLLCCIVVGFWAFRFDSKGKNHISVALLLLLGFLLRAYTASGLYLHCWDERYHALVAKNMMQNPFHPYLYKTVLLPYNYTNWTTNHIWLHKQPLSLWVMALSMKLFGVNEYAIRLPSLFFSTISIWLIYYIGTYLFSKKVAFLSAFFFAINGLVIEICSGRVATDHPDTLFLFFLLLSLFFTIRFIKQDKCIFNLIVGLSLGAALLTKWLPALIVLPIWLLLVWDSKKHNIKQLTVHFILVVFTAMIVFLPWQLYIHFQFHREAIWEKSYNTRHLWETLEGQGGAWYYYLNRIRIDYGELIYLPILWGLYQYAQNKKDFKLLVLIVWFSIPIIFFSFAATKMNGYLLIASPALFIISAAFFHEIKGASINSKFNWLKKIVMGLMIGLPIRYCIERVKPFEIKNRNPQWVTDLKNWNQKDNAKAVLFGYNAPIEAIFYTNTIVYEIVPHRSTILQLQQLGYKIFINELANPTNEIKDIQGISIIRLEERQY